MKEIKMATEKLDFGADVSRLLEIVAHALYSNRDVFLRELISNASDACDKLRYEAIKTPELTGDSGNLQIRIYKDTDYRALHVADNGIGMNKDELIDNLGTIAKSGTKALMEQVKATKKDDEKLSLIGQFGVGFYASFMVADKVEVISKKAGDKDCWHWESDGKTGFEVRKAKKDEAARLIGDQGTAIILHINADSSEYLIDDMLKKVIQDYSDHIDFPIYLGAPDEVDDEEQPVNSATALWAKSPQDCTQEQYNEFYKHIGHAMDEPLHTIHWRAEGVIEYSALLYLPTLRPWDLYDPSRKHAVKLYVKRVFIADDCEGLIYPWLRFMRGVIDSQDLPLNISREMLQHNPVVSKIRNGVAKRVLKEINKLAEDNKQSFEAFWAQFGSVLKEGLYDAVEHREDLLKAVRFYSTHQDGELTSLADYVERMKDGQDEIYYISGENLETLKNSPQLEGFKSRGLEVLFFTDTIDDFWLQSVPDYKDKKFKSATKGDIALDKFDTDDTKNEKDDKKQDDKNESKPKGSKKFLSTIQELLTEDVSNVRYSNRLTDSPVCLIADEAAVDLRMERVLKIHQQYQPETKRILEINPDHPLIKKMTDWAEKTDANHAELDNAAHLLLDQARIIQGEPVPDPARFAKTLSTFMERGIAA
jgi:molecular chaperone HtpG